MIYAIGVPLYSLIIVILLSFSSLVLAGGGSISKDQENPNILIVVADDLGFTDLGSFGGEISTPNLDDLATSGIRLTDFHAAPTCSPTRSMLLTGTDHHIAGLGNMIEHQAPNQAGKPGYEGGLNNDVVLISSLLKDAGYNTYMAGKWHLGMKPNQTPDARGFEQSFALMQGGASHFSDARGLTPDVPKGIYRDNGKPISKLPDGFYSSEFYTDKIIEYIESDRKDGKPFFAYLSYTAPHWPLQAPDNFIKRYQGKYDQGYDELRKNRLINAKRLGIIPQQAQGYPRAKGLPSWDQLSNNEQKIEARKMEVYGAMVENLDHHFGRLVDYLKSIDEYRNTFIVFISDNGTEGANRHKLPGNDKWIPETFDNSYENMGRPNSYIYYGAAWAQAGVAPLRMYKSFVSEGGIRVPAIVNYQGVKNNGSISQSFSSVLDIVPTLLELTKTTVNGKKTPSGKKVQPLRGHSMLDFLSGKSDRVHSNEYVMGWELFGHRAVRKGDWKLMWLSSTPPWLSAPEGSDQWGLYNLSTDPAELNDLSEKEPEKFLEMKGLWQKYLQENQIILPNWATDSKETSYLSNRH